jgi:hypothetical protein
LDTGANVSILPREVASDVTSLRSPQVSDGKYALAGVVEVPYQSYSLDLSILEYINNTIPELNLKPYTRPQVRNAVHLSGVEFQVPVLTWPEIAQKLAAETPMSVRYHEMKTVILGLHGVLDQLNLSFVGDNSVTVESLSH